MTYKCMIVDDEPLALDLMEGHISAVQELELVARCANALEAAPYLRECDIDVLFLDIQMPTINGIDFIKTLTKPPKIVLTTAYKDFAYDAFQLSVSDYLLKPITLARFLTSINKVLAGKIAQRTSQVRTEDSFERPFVYLKTAKKSVKVVLDQILYMESIKDYVRVVTSESTHVVHHRISLIEDRLPESRFLRIHRSFIVAINKIISYTKSTIEVDNKSLPIGRHYKEGVLEMLDEKKL